MHILIVEDDESLAEILQIHFKAVYNLRTEVVVSSDAAIQAVKRDRPNLILLDYWLKGGSADPFLQFYHTLYHKPPVVLFSGVTGANKIGHEHNIEFLAKPFDLDDLTRLLNKYMIV